MQNRPIIALDFANQNKVIEFLDQFSDQSLYVKVGMELYYSQGPSIIEIVKSRGHDIFLDLKLHDIPNTVGSAMKALAELDVDMVNVHAAGGRPMMEAALEGLVQGTKAGQERPLIIAVTQLTSTTEEQVHKEQLIQASLEESVLHYAKLTEESGLDGVVCSALESVAIKEHTNPNFLTVTPGIRPANTAVGDQKRVATPGDARLQKASGIVVGRPITQAADPRAAYEAIVKEWTMEG